MYQGSPCRLIVDKKPVAEDSADLGIKKALGGGVGMFRRVDDVTVVDDESRAIVEAL